PVGTRGRRTYDGGATNLASRATRLGVENVVVAHAVLIEIALIVARRGDGRIFEGDTGDDFILAIRVSDSHDPGFAETITDDAAVAAGTHQSTMNSVCLEHRDAS